MRKTSFVLLFSIACTVAHAQQYILKGTAGTGQSSSALYQTSTNLVGIGTTTAKSLLDVNGGMSIGTYAGVTAAPSNSVIISGSVGIGISSPSYPLDVNGNVNLRSNLYVSSTAWVTGATYCLSTLYTGGAASFSSTVGISGALSAPSATIPTFNGNVSFTGNQSVSGSLSAGATAITGNATVSGTVVIGSVTAPAGYNLYVANGILAEKYKCAVHTDNVNWSDYVFDKDYKLPDLNQVKDYIAANHHLPDVPSADEVYCDGIDMAQMDATLLKKVEELTLYVIELKKEVATIKSQK